MDKNSNTENLYRLNMSAIRIAISYSDGYSSLKLLNEILEVQTKYLEKFLTVTPLFNLLYGICFQSVIINLSNILVEDRNNDSVNIYYLKSFFTNSGKNYPNREEFEELIVMINKISEIYHNKSDFYCGLKELRDKYIAHIDKARFHSAKGPTIKISLDDIKLAYDSIGHLVDKLIAILGLDPNLIDFEQLVTANLQFRLLINDLKPKSIN